MVLRITSGLRVFLQVLIIALQAGLVVWVACSPLVWILRDGLGPDARESGWAEAVFRFAVQWGVPALALALPLYGLSLAVRRLARVERPVPHG